MFNSKIFLFRGEDSFDPSRVVSRTDEQENEGKSTAGYSTKRLIHTYRVKRSDSIEFIKLNQLYVFEFVNEVAFKAPNTLSQRVKDRKDNLPPTLRNSLDL